MDTIRLYDDPDGREKYLSLARSLYGSLPHGERLIAGLEHALSPDSAAARRQRRSAVAVPYEQWLIAHAMLIEDPRDAETKTGWLGFFDCVADDKVFGTLWSALMALCRERGIRQLRGPIDGGACIGQGFIKSGLEAMPLLRGELPCRDYYHSLLSMTASQRHAWRSACIEDPAAFAASLAADAKKAAADGLDIEEILTDGDRRGALRTAALSGSGAWGWIEPFDGEECADAVFGAPDAAIDRLLIARRGGQPAGYALAQTTDSGLTVRTTGDETVKKSLLHRLCAAQHTAATPLILAAVQEIPDGTKALRTYEMFEIPVL